MKPGEFSFELTDSCPTSVRARLKTYDHIVVTPARITDSGLGRTQLVGEARYTGRIEMIEGWKTFSGSSLMSWLGDGDSPSKGGFGPPGFIGGTAITGPGNWKHFVDAVFAEDLRRNGLTLGTYHSAFTTTIADDQIGENEAPRTAFDRFARITGNEYRVNADGTFDSGDPSALWKSGTAVDLVFTRSATGDDADGIKGVHVTDFRATLDGADLTNNPVVRGPTQENGGGAGTVRGFDGNFVAINKLFPVQTDDLGDIVGIYDYLSASRFPTTSGRFEIRLKTDAYDIGRYLTAGQPGDWIYVYDRDSFIVDGFLFAHSPTTNIVYRGETIFPLDTHRIVEISWPIREGMGVYLLKTRDGTGAVVDLSEFIKWETADTDVVLSTQNPLTLSEAVQGFN